MKSLASESKPFQSHSKGEIPSRTRFEIETGVHIIDSDTNLFMYLIQCIRFSS